MLDSINSLFILFDLSAIPKAIVWIKTKIAVMSLLKIMSFDAEIVQTLREMPEPLKQELLHYAKYLLENYSEIASERDLPRSKRRSGILKGTFVLPLPDDFDEPLEDFEEYME
jgi:hypothetical protein